MYLPSLFTAWLVAKLGLMRLMALGWLLYVSVIMIAFSGHEYMHYWWLMVTLGVGWNFLFTAGTLTLPKTYRPEERFKTQAVNDFTIFIFQAVASLSAGAVLFSQGWDRLISLAIPFILLLTLVVFAFSRLRPDEAQQ